MLSIANEAHSIYGAKPLLIVETCLYVKEKCGNINPTLKRATLISRCADDALNTIHSSSGG